MCSQYFYCICCWASIFNTVEVTNTPGALHRFQEHYRTAILFPAWQKFVCQLMCTRQGKHVGRKKKTKTKMCKYEKMMKVESANMRLRYTHAQTQHIIRNTIERKIMLTYTHIVLYTYIKWEAHTQTPLLISLMVCVYDWRKKASTSIDRNEYSKLVRIGKFPLRNRWKSLRCRSMAIYLMKTTRQRHSVEWWWHQRGCSEVGAEADINTVVPLLV